MGDFERMDCRSPAEASQKPSRSGSCKRERCHAVNGNGQSLAAEIRAMESKIGKRLYRGLLKKVARVWSPEQIRETSVLEHVLAQMQGAVRGLARLEDAQAKLAPEIIQRIIVSLNAPPAKLEDLHTLHALVVALEKEVDAQMQP
jgi:hypothetical protein